MLGAARVELEGVASLKALNDLDIGEHALSAASLVATAQAAANATAMRSMTAVDTSRCLLRGRMNGKTEAICTTVPEPRILPDEGHFARDIFF